ncbi:unnamed protein product, partial [Mesorhabditis spiculigera]
MQPKSRPILLFIAAVVGLFDGRASSPAGTHEYVICPADGPSENQCPPVDRGTIHDRRVVWVDDEAHVIYVYPIWAAKAKALLAANASTTGPASLPPTEAIAMPEETSTEQSNPATTTESLSPATTIPSTTTPPSLIVNDCGDNDEANDNSDHNDEGGPHYHNNLPDHPNHALF